MKKKIIQYALAFTAITAMLCITTMAATITPSTATITVDGVATTFEAYTIDGNNYVKLRDVAYALSGTSAQFDVGWDGTAIYLADDLAYTAVGGEMTGSATYTSGTLNQTMIYVDGVARPVMAYTIADNNFFKLRDVAQLMDFGVDWSQETGTVVIDSTVGYTIPETTDGVNLNTSLLMTVGESVGSLTDRLGTASGPDDYGCLSYSNGLYAGTALGTYADNDVVTSLSGITAADLFTNCPSTMSASQVIALFGNGYTEESEGYLIDCTFGEIDIFIYTDSNFNVSPNSTVICNAYPYYTYYNVYDPNNLPEFPAAAATTTDTADTDFVNIEGYWERTPTEGTSAGGWTYTNILEVTISNQTATQLTFSTNYSSYRTADVGETVAYSTDGGLTYVAEAATDSFYNTCCITLAYQDGQLYYDSNLIATDPMANFAHSVSDLLHR